MSRLPEEERVFILRQLVLALGDVKQVNAEVETKLREIVGQPNVEDFIAKLQEAKSLSQTLVTMGIFDIDEALFEAIKNIEKEQQNRVPINSLKRCSESFDDSIKLLRTRIIMGLPYLVLLLAVSQIVTIVLGLGVLNELKVNFGSLGVDMPSLTQWSIAWYDSPFSPMVINAILLLFALVLLVGSFKLSFKAKNIALLARIPGLNAMTKLMQQFRALFVIELHQQANLDLDSALKSPLVADQLSKPLINQLEKAQALNTLGSEIEFHIQSTIEKSQQVALRSARLLMGGIGLFTVLFVVLILFATYLPLFSLGASV